MEHRYAVGRWASTAVAIGTIAALVVGVVALSYDRPSRVTDHQPAAGIWVVDESAGLLGRADPRAGTVDATMELAAGDVEIVQSSNTAVVIDRTRSVASVVDAAALTRSDEVRLPARDAQVTLAMVDQREPVDPLLDAVVLTPRAGDVWIMPVGDVGRFDADAPPAFSFGTGASAAVGEEGRLYVASPRDGALYEIDHDGAHRRAGFTPFRGSASDPVQVSVGAGGWSVLDRAARRVITDDGVVDLPGDSGELALETTLSPTIESAPATASSADGTSVALVAADDGLVEASIDRVRSLVRVDGESPVRPLRLGDCVYGAWESHTLAVGCAQTARPATVGHTEPWSPAPEARPRLRTDGHTVIANDAATGHTWAITPDGSRPFVWTGGHDSDEVDLSGPSPKTGVLDEASPPRAGDVLAPDPQRPAPDAGSTVTDAAVRSEPRPLAAEGPTVLSAGDVEATVDDSAGTIAVSWQPFTSAGSGVLGYLVQRLAPGDEAGTCAIDQGRATVAGGEVRATTGTSTLYGGERPPDGGYRFVVTGYTDGACVSSAPIEVRPTPVPDAVGDLRGEMAWIGTRWDYRVSPGQAPRYEVERLDAAGAATGSTGVFSETAMPRELTGGAFGETVTFRIRACAPWGADAACGPWTEHAAPEPSLDFTLADLAYSEDTGEWTWSALPDNGTAKVRVFGLGGSGAQWEAGALYCRANAPVAPADAVLTIRIDGQVREVRANEL